VQQQDLEVVDVVIGDEVIKEDDDEIQQRKERTAVVVQELSDLVNYVVPYHFRVWMGI
jgi:hypothetical protein